MSDSAFAIVFFAIIGGALRVSTPFMFVALGECLTEKSGRVNLGLEGTLVLGAMTAYAVSYHTGYPWLGVFAAGLSGAGRARRSLTVPSSVTPMTARQSASVIWSRLTWGSEVPALITRIWAPP